jgi:hypothetical protein
MAVSRSDVLQGILNGFDEPNYLEIGVFDGEIFHDLRAASKVAVDPDFRFDVAAARAGNPGATYFAVGSDAYFLQHAGDAKFEVIYLDGLHVFEQMLRDLMNAMHHIAPTGVIIIDGVVPNAVAATLPDYSNFDRNGPSRRPPAAQVGDAHKLVLFVDTFLPAWTFRCVAEDRGQLVMWPRKRPNGADRTIQEIGLAGQDRAIVERGSFRLAAFDEILIELQQGGS